MRRLSLSVTLLAFAACAPADGEPAAATTSGSPAVGDAALATLLVYKTPTCGCCNGWIDHMESAGYTVDARDVRDLMSIKRDAGVPVSMTSCHTTLIDGYVVEGHVPVEQVQRLLAERPAVAGIAVPGMPIGSPGMEGRNAEPYQVLSFSTDGSSAVFAEIDPS